MSACASCVWTQELQAIVEVAEFMHYWSRQGCGLEMETEYAP